MIQTQAVIDEITHFCQTHPIASSVQVAAERTLQLLRDMNSPTLVKLDDPGHITASMLVLSSSRDEVLLMHHRKLERWFQFGGHTEEQDDTLFLAACREVEEEAGLSPSQFTTKDPTLQTVDVHTIPARGDIAEHLHFDLRYVCCVPRDTTLSDQDSGVNALRWFKASELEALDLDDALHAFILQHLKS